MRDPPGRNSSDARWRVDYLGKKATHLGSVDAVSEAAAVEEAAKQFNIPPARRSKIVVTKIEEPKAKR